MTRAKRATYISGVAALALPLLPVAPGAATAAPGGGEHFGPAQRTADIARARTERGETARHLRLTEAEALVVKDVVVDATGERHVRYDRTYRGLPVIGGDLVVHEDADGEPTRVTWDTRRSIGVKSLDPAVSPQQAAGLAARATGLAGGQAAPRKVVFAADHEPVLAWETTVTGAKKDGTPVVDRVYVDAQTGARLATFPLVHEADGTGESLHSGTVPLKTVASGSSYQLTDTTRGGHRTNDANNGEDIDAPGTLFTDADNAWGDGAAANRQTVAVDAAYGAAETWDYFQERFGRSGIRNDGVAAFSRVHFGNSYENAFWYDGCFCMTYGDGGTTFKPLASLDVAGHEMSHGVTSNTAGLVYFGDAGGLNEATSDVFGSMVEFSAGNRKDKGDYYIGEKIMRDGTQLRRMDDPDSDGLSVNCWTPSTGDLDPHFSSGVGNHAFYLLAEGTGSTKIGGRRHSSTSCDGSKVPGIGRNQAAAIWYQALTTQWTSTTSYPQAADGMVRAAKGLYGESSKQCKQTVRAWRAVDVPTTEKCGTTGGSTNRLKNPGFESGATDWVSTNGVITNSPNGLPHSGAYYAWLNGYGRTSKDSVQQRVRIPSSGRAVLRFWLLVDTAEASGKVRDRLKVQVVGGGKTRTVKRFSNLHAGGGYQQHKVGLSSFKGKKVVLRFVGTENASERTSFLLDDTSLTTR